MSSRAKTPMPAETTRSRISGLDINCVSRGPLYLRKNLTYIRSTLKTIGCKPPFHWKMTSLNLSSTSNVSLEGKIALVTGNTCRSGACVGPAWLTCNRSELGHRVGNREAACSTRSSSRESGCSASANPRQQYPNRIRQVRSIFVGRPALCVPQVSPDRHRGCQWRSIGVS